jgi:hypothetical protein
MGVSGHQHALALLHLWERTPGTHWIGGWVGLRAGLDTEARRKIICPCRGSNPGHRVWRQILYCLSYSSALVVTVVKQTIKDENWYISTYTTGIISNVFRPMKTRIKVYNTLALPTLLYSSENWTIKTRDATRVTAAEMKYIRRAAEYT